MAFVTRTVLGLAAWFAVRAGSTLELPDRAFLRPAAIPAAIPAAAGPDNMVRANRAGRLVPVPDDPEASRSLLAHWALWVAVVLILLVLAAGYVRRRWKSGRRRGQVPALDRDGSRK